MDIMSMSKSINDGSNRAVLMLGTRKGQREMMLGIEKEILRIEAFH